jgi:Patatin-like phospholipase
VPQDDRLDEIAVLWEEAYYFTRGGEPTREAAARQAEKELEPYKNAVEHGRAELDRLKARKDAGPDDLRKAEIALDTATLVYAQAPYALLHQKNRWALCLSGGGIRSATFALGVLEGLAANGVLNRFDYLSTVSGGGYIGSWLSAWCSNKRNGTFRTVVDSLERAAKQNAERSPIRHLRSYSNYLTPKLGILSADTWASVATYARNLLLNWLVLIPLLMAVLLTPHIGLALVALAPSGIFTSILDANWATAACTAFLFAAFALIRAMIYVGYNRPSSVRAFGRVPAGQADFLLRCLLPLMLAAIFFSLSWAWLSHGKLPEALYFPYWHFAIAGAILRVVGWVFLLPGYGAWHKAPPQSGRAHKRAWELPIALFTGAVGGLLVWCATFLFPLARNDAALEVRLVCFFPPLLLLIFLVAEVLYIGLASRMTTDEDREWWGRSGGWVLVVGIGWMALRILVLYGPIGIGWATTQLPQWLVAIGGVSGIATALIGNSGATPAGTDKSPMSGIARYFTGPSLAVTATLFVVTLFALVALVNDKALYAIAVQLAPEPTGEAPSPLVTAACTAGTVSHLRDIGVEAAQALCQVHVIPLGLIVAAIVALLILALVVSHFVNVNRFSLHAMYRSRLIRAYLGASNSKRKPHPFTGFDENDNLKMWELQERPGEEPRGRPPFHVVNVALNLVAGRNLAWQERKAASFTISPLHCGSGIEEIGYRRSRYYGGPDGISLGTAMTISGAAASPNMGYHSSPLVTLIMTLFNARLGWWLGNPGTAGDKTFALDGPGLALQPLLSEAFGLTDDRNHYVYLSDGGHFENLGLYEMVRRRCQVIVVSDAGCDKDFKFEDLGNALRKIRIDLGVEIEFFVLPRLHEFADEEGAIICNPDEPYSAIGTITYPEFDSGGKRREGVLLYLKPAMHGDEPTDVLNYRATHDSFPHEPTSDQWFSESQFESYRRLGLHIVTKEIDRLRASAHPKVEPFKAALPPK